MIGGAAVALTVVAINTGDQFAIDDDLGQSRRTRSNDSAGSIQSIILDNHGGLQWDLAVGIVPHGRGHEK